MTTGEYYNPAANTWQNITPMGTRRSCLGICAYDGLIYCVGGYDGASCLSSVERYDPLTAMWTSSPAMNTKRRYCRSVVLGNYIIHSNLDIFDIFFSELNISNNQMGENVLKSLEYMITQCLNESVFHFNK